MVNSKHVFSGNQGEWDSIRLFYEYGAWYYNGNKIKYCVDASFINCIKNLP